MKITTAFTMLWVTPASASLLILTSSTNNVSTPKCTGDFNDGVYLGADLAESIWKDMGSTCSKIWSFADTVDDYLDEYYPTDTSDWRRNSCNEGVAKGVSSTENIWRMFSYANIVLIKLKRCKSQAQQVVDKYEKKCLDDTPDECYDLGQAAAQSKWFGAILCFPIWDTMCWGLSDFKPNIFSCSMCILF